MSMSGRTYCQRDNPMPDTHSDAGRNQAERLGALEQNMRLALWRLDHYEQKHENIPQRVDRLELIAQNQSKLLETLSSDVKGMGIKVMYGLGAAGAIIAVINMVGPHILRAVIP
uniref:Uncharacterized protein n=1 Tax=Pakpunavirus sp. TaxID=2833053 RepID=A0AB39BYV1_9CAUD